MGLGLGLGRRLPKLVFDAQVSVIYRYCPRLTAGKGEFL